MEEYMVILLDATPSNDEVMGYVIVFGLMLLCFLIALLFKGVDKPSSMPVLAPVQQTSGKGCFVLICVVVGVILWIIHNPH